MCDYSLEMVQSRPAEVGEDLVVQRFFSHTTGFVSPKDREVAVCVLPGTEIGFEGNIKAKAGFAAGVWIDERTFDFAVAVFDQVEPDTRFTHHDALRLPNGEMVKLNELEPGQTAKVLQLPIAAEKNTISHIELPCDVEPAPAAPETTAAPFYAEIG